MKALSVNDKITLALFTVLFSSVGTFVAIICVNVPAAAILATIAVKAVSSTQQAIRNTKTSCPLSDANQFTLAKLKEELEVFDSAKPHNRRKSDQKSRARHEVRRALLQRA